MYLLVKIINHTRMSPLYRALRKYEHTLHASVPGIITDIIIRRFLHSKSFKNPMVWTYHPFMLEAIKTIKKGPLVYHCVDDLSAIPGIDSESFNKEEQRLLTAAKVVFTTSTALLEKCSAHNVNTHYFPNVADVDHFSQALLTEAPLPADLLEIPEPRIGYVGMLSDFKVDFQLLIDVAILRPEWSFVLIGEEREGQSSQLAKHLRSLPNVYFLGYRPYQRLPDYLRGFNVALLPTLINDYTRSMFPMKYFEYLAAGLPVVSTPLDCTKDMLNGIKVVDSAEEFSNAVSKQLQRGRMSVTEAEQCIGENTWDMRLNKMLEYIVR